MQLKGRGERPHVNVVQEVAIVYCRGYGPGGCCKAVGCSPTALGRSVFRVREPRRGLSDAPRNSKCAGSNVRVCRPSRRRVCARSISFRASSVAAIQTPGVRLGYSSAYSILSRASRTLTGAPFAGSGTMSSVDGGGVKSRTTRRKLEHTAVPPYRRTAVAASFQSDLLMEL